MTNILEAVVNGLVPRPTTRLLEADFRFSDGSELHLEGDALEMWVMMYKGIVLAVNAQMQSGPPPQAPAPHKPAANITVDEIRRRDKGKPPDDGE